MDDRIRATPKAERRRDRTSILAKLGGVLESSELRPNRTGRRQSLIKTYRDLRRYQQGVDRLTRAGWIIERESDPDQHIDGAIVVTWAREPQD